MARIMISLPDDLLTAVDAQARSQARSRSEFVREALRNYLVSGDVAKRREAIARLKETFRTGRWRAEDLVRSERDR